MYVKQAMLHAAETTTSSRKRSISNRHTGRKGTPTDPVDAHGRTSKRSPLPLPSGGLHFHLGPAVSAGEGSEPLAVRAGVASTAVAVVLVMMRVVVAAGGADSGRYSGVVVPADGGAAARGGTATTPPGASRVGPEKVVHAAVDAAGTEDGDPCRTTESSPVLAPSVRDDGSNPFSLESLASERFRPSRLEPRMSGKTPPYAW